MPATLTPYERSLQRGLLRKSALGIGGLVLAGFAGTRVARAVVGRPVDAEVGW